MPKLPMEVKTELGIAPTRRGLRVRYSAPCRGRGERGATLGCQAVFLKTGMRLVGNRILDVAKTQGGG